MSLPVTASGIPKGLEHISPEHLIVPRLRLCQAQSRIQGVTPGEYYWSISLPPSACVEWVPLRASTGRLWLPEMGRGDKPLCSSSDGRTPDERYPSPPSHVCHACPKAIWKDGVPPPCSDTYSFLGVTVAGQIPFIITFRGTSATPARRLLSSLALLPHPSGGIYDVRIAMAARPQSNARGQYFVPDFHVNILEDWSVYENAFTVYGNLRMAAEEPENESRARSDGEASGGAGGMDAPGDANDDILWPDAGDEPRPGNGKRRATR